MKRTSKAAGKLTHRAENKVSPAAENFTLPGFFCAFLPSHNLHFVPGSLSPSTCDIFRFLEACVSAAVWLMRGGGSAQWSLARLRHLKYWIRDVFRAEMSNPASSTVYLLQSAMLLYTAATATALTHTHNTHTHTHTHTQGRQARTHSNICRAPTLLAGSLMLLYGA